MFVEFPPTAESIIRETWVLSAPMDSAAFAHTAATSEAAEAKAESQLLPLFAANPAMAAATSATESAA